MPIIILAGIFFVFSVTILVMATSNLLKGLVLGLIAAIVAILCALTEGEEQKWRRK